MISPKENFYSFLLTVLYVVLTNLLNVMNCDLAQTYVKKTSVVGTPWIELTTHTGLRGKSECGAVCSLDFRCNYFHFADGVCQLLATEQLTQAGETIYSKVGNDAENGYWRVRNTTCGGPSPISQKYEVTTPQSCRDQCSTFAGCIGAVYAYSRDQWSKNKNWCYVKTLAEMPGCVDALKDYDYRDFYFKI